jgi:hypothetical protein
MFYYLYLSIFRKTATLAAGERQASSARYRVLPGSRLSRFPAGVSAVLLHIWKSASTDCGSLSIKIKEMIHY